MLTNYPTSIVVHGMALNITVQSYDQSLDFGLMADAAAMPDVRELADAIRIAFDDLRALPRPGERDADDTPAEGLVGKTTRLAGDFTGAVSGAVTGAMGKAARHAMHSAVDAAVAQVTGRKTATPRASAPAKQGRAD
jgi:hypothetical protein